MARTIRSGWCSTPTTQSGSTRDVHFTTTKSSHWRTNPRKCHVNYAMLDSNWEGEFCRVAEAHPKVRAYVKNHNLGLEVPYRMGAVPRIYLPDFIVRVDDGEEDPLNLVVEIKGYRGEDAIVKKTTMENYWVPGINRLAEYGRWDFTEITDVHSMENVLDQLASAAPMDTSKAARQLALAGGSEPQLEPIPRRRSAVD